MADNDTPDPGAGDGAGGDSGSTAGSSRTTSSHPFKARDKGVVISGGVRYAKADLEREDLSGIEADKSPYTSRAVANKQRSTR